MLGKCLLFIKQTLKPLSFQMCVVPTQGHSGSQGTEAGPVSLYLHFEKRAQHFSHLQKNTNICLWSSFGVPAAVCYCCSQALAAKAECSPSPPGCSDFPCSQFQTISSTDVRSNSSTNYHVTASFLNSWPMLFFFLLSYSFLLWMIPFLWIHFSLHCFLCSFSFFLLFKINSDINILYLNSAL